jgi:3-hydroxybutyryl-CoA dehydrogenase
MAAELERVGVVGAGFMGSGIAESAARAGCAVTLHEPEAAPLERSRGRIEASVGRAVEGGKLSAEEASALVDRIEWTTDPDALGDAGIVVEAVIEDAALKGSVFQTLDHLLG